MKVVFTKDAVDKMQQIAADRSDLGKLLAEIMRLSELWEYRLDPGRRGNGRAVVAVSNDLRAIMTEDTKNPDRVVVMSVYREGTPNLPTDDAEKSQNLQNHFIV